jgi:hypothetical protein
MYKVEAKTIEEYFNAGEHRKSDLMAVDALIRRTVPNLKRWFYLGVQAGEAGMRMTMIGYGVTQYRVKSGKHGKWPIIGLALQKNYVSIYVAVNKNGLPIVDEYKGQLGELRTGMNNFSFVNFDQLHQETLIALLKDIDNHAGPEEGG